LRLAALLWWPTFGLTSSFFSSFSSSFSYLSTPCHNLGTFARLDSLPFLFDGLGLAGRHLGMLLVLESSRILNLSLFFHRMRLCTNIHTSMRLYARNGVEIVKSKIRGNLVFRVSLSLAGFFAETSQIHSADITCLFLHIGLHNGMSNLTLKRNDEIEPEKSSKPAWVFAISPGFGATVLACVPLFVSIKFYGTTLVVRVSLYSYCPAAHFFVFFVFSFFRRRVFVSALCFCDVLCVSALADAGFEPRLKTILLRLLLFSGVFGSVVGPLGPIWQHSPQLMCYSVVHHQVGFGSRAVTPRLVVSAF